MPLMMKTYNFLINLWIKQLSKEVEQTILH